MFQRAGLSIRLGSFRFYIPTWPLLSVPDLHVGYQSSLWTPTVWHEEFEQTWPAACSGRRDGARRFNAFLSPNLFLISFFERLHTHFTRLSRVSLHPQ